MASIHANLDAMVQWWTQGISQEASKYSLKYVVGDIFEEFECNPCGLFEGFSYHKEDEAIAPNLFAATVGLGDRIQKFVLSNFMGITSSVSVILDNGDNYSCSSNKGDFLDLEEKMLLINIKGTSKGLEISGFGIFKYSVRSESVHMIVLQDQAYYVPMLPKDFSII